MEGDSFGVARWRKHLSRIALGDFVAARLLWNLGLLPQAMVLSLQSLEKYLKLYRESTRPYDSTEVFDKALRRGNHSLVNILNSIPKSLQGPLKGCKAVATRLDALRYADSPFIGYSEQGFRDNERFIKRLRQLLGESTSRSHFGDWRSISLPEFPRARKEVAEIAVKKILSLKNSPHTKKARLAFRLAVARALNRKST